MSWLNWLLKLHIRLRTISLLISTHNTQIYAQWMPYSFVWLYLIKCVFTCSIFVDSSTKRFLSVLGVFGKYFVLQKNWKFQKTFLPCFGDSVTGKSSRMAQSQARGSVLETCSRVEGPVARGTQRFSQLSSRLPREWDYQSRKPLRKFFKTFGLKCFGGWCWWLPGDLPQSQKMRVLHNKSSF